MASTELISRQQWLDQSVQRVTRHFHQLGYEVPQVQISCGFPSTGSRSNRIGECWPTSRCSGGMKQVKLMASELGDYPHKRLITKPRSTIKRQRPYAECSECGYQVPMLKKFLVVGPPICPKDNIMMMPEGKWD